MNTRVILQWCLVGKSSGAQEKMFYVSVIKHLYEKGVCAQNTVLVSAFFLLQLLRFWPLAPLTVIYVCRPFPGRK